MNLYLNICKKKQIYLFIINLTNLLCVFNSCRDIHQVYTLMVALGVFSCIKSLFEIIYFIYLGVYFQVYLIYYRYKGILILLVLCID